MVADIRVNIGAFLNHYPVCVVYMCVHMYEHQCMCVEAEVSAGRLPLSLSALCSETGLSFSLELTNPASLAGQQTRYSLVAIPAALGSQTPDAWRLFS